MILIIVIVIIVYSFSYNEYMNSNDIMFYLLFILGMYEYSVYGSLS